jgi:hypothetical protein
VAKGHHFTESKSEEVKEPFVRIHEMRSPDKIWTVGLERMWTVDLEYFGYGTWKSQWWLMFKHPKCELAI